MTHQEIEEAIKIVNLKKELDEKDCSCHISPPCPKCVDTPTDDDIYEAVYTIIDLAKLHLSVMKSGVPKKKVILPMSTDYRYGKSTQRSLFSYNQAIDKFTAYLAQKLSGLEEVIRESSLCRLCLTEVWEAEKEIKELVSMIRKHLEVEKCRK